MFEKARIKLTAWYLVIIMSISLLFSLVIYQSANMEFDRFERMEDRISKDYQKKLFMLPPNENHRKDFIIFTQDDSDTIHKARERFLIMLGFINLSILAIAGISGYFLAGRTLKPIKEMMDEQKRFISDSSHELRTPIATLRTEIEVALRNKNLSLKQSKIVLKSNLEETIGLQTLSNNLLELAQNGKLVKKNNLKEISIKEVLEIAIKKTEIFAKKKNIKLEKNIKNTKIIGVNDRLIELFVILIDNAIKYSKNGQTIKINSDTEKGRAQIQIIDQGIGISENDLPYIFDRFYRSDKSRNEKGYGLGLSIAKKITELHNGSISVESKLGEGSKFIVNFPLKG